jgi:hypothetical protein
MNTKREIEQLKTDVNEIKNLLKELINASKWYWIRKFEQKFWIS